MELHTFSSLDRNFIPNYSNVFNDADEVWIFIPEKELKRKGLIDIDSKFIINVINHNNLNVLKDKISLKEKIDNRMNMSLARNAPLFWRRLFLI